jgi:hypothetical protein
LAAEQFYGRNGNTAFTPTAPVMRPHAGRLTSALSDTAQAPGGVKPLEVV